MISIDKHYIMYSHLVPLARVIAIDKHYIMYSHLVPLARVISIHKHYIMYSHLVPLARVISIDKALMRGGCGWSHHKLTPRKHVLYSNLTYTGSLITYWLYQ